MMSLKQESNNAKVIAIHMNAIDHCRTTKAILKAKAQESNVTEGKLLIPQDGEVIVL